MLYLIFSLVFLFSLHLTPYFASQIIKATPAILLAIQFFAIGKFTSPYRWFLIGFLFSGLGDIFLELDNTKYFIHGLGSFLVAHLFYSMGLLSKRSSIKEHKLIVSIIIIFSVIMLSVLSPNLDNLLIPVSLYILVITIMGILSCGFLGDSPLITLGACLFIISDSLIAINKFLIVLPMAGTLIMITYYSANYFIGYGFLNHRGAK